MTQATNLIPILESCIAGFLVLPIIVLFSLHYNYRLYCPDNRILLLKFKLAILLFCLLAALLLVHSYLNSDRFF
jgi:hypothetical protein